VPTYEYACRECGRHLEVQQSFSDAALTECPHCAGPLRKVFAAPGISFKGSGFYKNDSRSSSSSSKTASGSSDGGSSTSGDSSASNGKESATPAPGPTKSDAKPAAPAKPAAAAS
jgi:putative FmdB family regulatory protein